MSFGICYLPVASLVEPSFAQAYRLAPGDQLEIKVIGKSDLSTKQIVTPDGSISLPLVGRSNVKGLTLKELDIYLTKNLSKYLNKPQIVVYLTPRPIYVVQYDQKKNVWDVKEARSVSEANAYLGTLTTSGTIEYGDKIIVKTSKEPDFWEENWYKIVTATAVLAGVYATLNR